MKKKATLIIWLTLTAHLVVGQQLNIGDKVPNASIDLISPINEMTSLNDMKGKVVILDFWATWCGPCISNMAHLDSLHKKFAGALEIIAVSHEERGRLERFAKKRPVSFEYALSSDGILQDLFPHRVIPHSVIIDKSGVVRAITNPQNIDATVIQAVLNQETIDLPVKSDNIEFDYAMDYFNRDSSTIEAFEIQPYNPDIPSFTKYQQGGNRITMHNTTITGMYREAFEMSSYRLVFDIDGARVDWENTANRFNLDILVAPADSNKVKDVLKEKLLSTLEIKARVEKRTMEVIVMTLNDSIPFGLGLSNTEQTELTSRGDQYISNSASLNEFAQYLENYGIVGMPVKDETGLAEKYKFNFAFDPENSQSFFDEMDRMGLKLKRKEREIEVLVIYEEVGND